MWYYRTDSQIETREKADKRKCCKGNLEKMNVWEETLDKTRRNKKPWLKIAATSEEGEDNRQRH
jgi:hypothetical protein